MSNVEVTGRSAGGRAAGLKLLAVGLVAGLLPACGKNVSSTPTVIQVSPSSVAVTPLSAPIFIYWDRPMDPSSFGGNFVINNSLGSAIQAPTILYFPAQNLVVLNPAPGSMMQNSTYTVVILGAVSSASGTQYGGNSFTVTTDSSTLSGVPGFTGATSATPQGSGKVQINWGAASNADSTGVIYNIYYSSSPGGEDFLNAAQAQTPIQANGGANITGATLTLTPGTYYFIVEAVEQTSGNVNWNLVEVSANVT